MDLAPKKTATIHMHSTENILSAICYRRDYFLGVMSNSVMCNDHGRYYVSSIINIINGKVPNPHLC